MVKKKGLGKGLHALFEDNQEMTSEIDEKKTDVTKLIKISDIQPNAQQPRCSFDEDSLRQLADSINQHGMIQPLILRSLTTGGYEIVAGERRYRASQMVGLVELPAIIKELSDLETMEIALIENLQREDLNPLEEAMGYQQLMEKHHFTQEKVATRVGKSRPAVANALRLLQLPELVLGWVKEGQLSAGQARTLLGLQQPEQMILVGELTIEKNLTVRELEKLVKKYAHTPWMKQQDQPLQHINQHIEFTKKQQDYQQVQLALTSQLGRTVKIKTKAKKSILMIEFDNLEDLKALVDYKILPLASTPSHSTWSDLNNPTEIEITKSQQDQESMNPLATNRTTPDKS